MRILEFVISLEKGGRTKLILQLSRHLMLRGHRVITLVLQQPPEWVQQDLLHDLDWHCIPHGKGIDLQLLWRLFNYIRREKFTAIHAHCETSMLYGGMIGRLLGIPVLGTYHRSILSAYAPRWQWRFIAGLLTSVVAVSRQRAELLMQNLRVASEKIQVIHGAIAFDEFSAVDHRVRQVARIALGLSPDEVVWFSAGHLGEIKGHDDTIKALALLREELSVHLYIAGDGEEVDYQRLKTLAEKMQVADQVFFLGQVNEIPVWLAACNLFVQPSHEEAFGLVFAEAGAAQRAVVATSVGGIPDIVLHEETGFLVAPHAPIELAAALLLLSKNHDLADAMGVAARQRVQKYFTLDYMFQQYETLLEKLVSAE
jgi:glycosyltransferase involved in cell wall biosynthesis